MVGDLVKVEDKQQIPADLVLLSSSLRFARCAQQCAHCTFCSPLWCVLLFSAHTLYLPTILLNITISFCQIWWLFCDDRQSGRRNQLETVDSPKVREVPTIWYSKGNFDLSSGFCLPEKSCIWIFLVYRETRQLVTPHSLGQLEAQVTIFK